MKLRQGRRLDTAADAGRVIGEADQPCRPFRVALDHRPKAIDVGRRIATPPLHANYRLIHARAPAGVGLPRDQPDVAGANELALH